MADAFKYLSPRQFQKLRPTEKDRYLAALFKHLHEGPHDKRAAAVRSKDDKPKSHVDR